MTQTQALTHGLARDESDEHARLLNDYVRAVETHKNLLGAAVRQARGHVLPEWALSEQQLRDLWFADARIESTRRDLESFRQSHGIP